MSIKANPLSMGDPVGRKFFWKEGMYRGIYPGYANKVKELFDIGLISKLEQENLIPKTTISKEQLDGFEMILEQEKIHPVVYPYEWSFEMFKDAALTTLKVNKILMEFGYETKDAHPSNIMFQGTTPKFIDIGSIQKMNPGQMRWTAHSQFIHSFLEPLKVGAISDFSVTNTLLRNEVGVESYSYLTLLHPINRLLGIKTAKKIQVAKEKYLSLGVSDKENITTNIPSVIVNTFLGLKKYNLLPFIKTNLSLLERKVRKITRSKVKTVWGNYHDNFELTPRFKRLAEIINSVHVKSIFEVAANQGFFSKYLLEHMDLDWIVATDYDSKAVDTMYKENKGNKKFFVAFLNLMFPAKNSLSLKLKYRYKADIVLALAVTHHLILTQGYQFDIIIDKLSKYTNKYLLIEFMPLGLYSIGYEPKVPEWYTKDWYRSELEKRYSVIIEEQVEKNRIVFLCEKK